MWVLFIVAFSPAGAPSIAMQAFATKQACESAAISFSQAIDAGRTGDPWSKPLSMVAPQTSCRPRGD